MNRQNVYNIPLLPTEAMSSRPPSLRNTSVVDDNEEGGHSRIDDGLIVGWPSSDSPRDEATASVPSSRAAKFQEEVVHAKTESPRVRFHPYTDLKLIETADELTAEEIERTWYSDEEYRTVKKQAKAILGYTALVRERGAAATAEQRKMASKLCMRGLEHLDGPEVQAERRTRKDAVVNAVLDEQDRQEMDGALGSVQAEHAMSVASTIASKRARELALSAGTSDALAAASLRKNEAGFYWPSSSCKLPLRSAMKRKEEESQERLRPNLNSEGSNLDKTAKPPAQQRSRSVELLARLQTLGRRGDDNKDDRDMIEPTGKANQEWPEKKSSKPPSNHSTKENAPVWRTRC